MSSARSRWVGLLAAAIAAIGLSACGGSDDSSPPPAVGPSAQTVGPAGGTITGESGLAVAIPAGALTESVTIRMARDATGAPAIDAGSKLAGPIHALTPHGITFARPAVVRIPFDPSTSPESGAVPVLFKASPGGQWMALADTARDGDTLLADVTSFSYFVVQWCRPRYTSTAPGVTLAECSYAQRDVSIEFVSPLPPVPPVGRSDPRAALGLRAIDPALQITRPSLLVIRVAVEALYATDTPDHLVEFEIIDYHGHAVAGGAFPSADLRGGRKIIDVAVAVLESDNGLRPYRVEVFCRATDSAGSCSGRLIGNYARTPEVPPYRVAGNTLLVNVAIPAGTPPDPAALPMVRDMSPNMSKDSVVLARAMRDAITPSAPLTLALRSSIQVSSENLITRAPLLAGRTGSGTFTSVKAPRSNSASKRSRGVIAMW